MKPIDVYPSRLMNPICHQAGCPTDLASKHAWQWERKRWHSHPDPDFIAWWEPSSLDPVSGAHRGGHPEAYRSHARKDEGKYSHQNFGLTTELAWNTAHYKTQFNEWETIGSPAPDYPFTSISSSLNDQRAFWQTIRQTISSIGQAS